MKRLTSYAISGVLFGIGLTLSGMTRPDKVIGFLDVSDSWDPSLAFVMIGAIAIQLIAYTFEKSMDKPILSTNFLIPTRKDIDLRLIGGAVFFGVGWGIAGVCPGPALVAAGTGKATAWLFVATMFSGMALFQAIQRIVVPLFSRQKLPFPSHKAR